MQSQVTSSSSSSLLSVDAKPRLKWTRELHESFVHAVSQLGGVDKATPKSVMRIMGVPGLTLYHLKSHLQKYRLSKIRDHGSRKEEISEQDDVCNQQSINETVLRIQMEVQRKLQEQIEVQKHLQIRIEAQGKYLQTVLRKAQETLVSYTSKSMGVEEAKAEITELVHAVDSQYLSSGFMVRNKETTEHQQQEEDGDCSIDDSCLTCCEKAEGNSEEFGETNPDCTRVYDQKEQRVEKKPEFDLNS